MICRIIAIPEAGTLQFTAWTAARANAFLAAFFPQEMKSQVREAGESISDYFAALVKERRNNQRGDLLSELIRAEHDGDRLSGDELSVHVIGYWLLVLKPR